MHYANKSNTSAVNEAQEAAWQKNGIHRLNTRAYDLIKKKKKIMLGV